MHRQMDRQTSEQGDSGWTDRQERQQFSADDNTLLTAASQGPEAVAAGGTAVAASADDVGFALALPALHLALAAAGALRVTLARCGSRTSVGPGLPSLHLPRTCPCPVTALLPAVPWAWAHPDPAHAWVPTHAEPRRASGLRRCTPGGHRPGPGGEGGPCETLPGTGTAPAPPGGLLPLPRGSLAAPTPGAAAPAVGKEEEMGLGEHRQPPLWDLPLGWICVLQDSPSAAGVNYPSSINSPSSTDIPSPIDIPIEIAIPRSFLIPFHADIPMPTPTLSPQSH